MPHVSSVSTSVGFIARPDSLRGWWIAAMETPEWGDRRMGENIAGPFATKRSSDPRLHAWKMQYPNVRRNLNPRRHNPYKYKATPEYNFYRSVFSSRDNAEFYVSKLPRNYDGRVVPYGSREWAAEWKQSRKGGKKKINRIVGKLIPAKVMVGKGGKVRVFVNPKHLPTLK